VKPRRAKGATPASVLYITYDGLLEPLGQSQVWKYVRGLSRNHKMFVISYEKEDDFSNLEKLSALRNECQRAGVEWIALKYHKRPTAPATTFDICVGIGVAIGLICKFRIRTVHARSYVPAAIALVLKLLTGIHFIFDMRGFWADEKVDGGSWRRSSALFKLAKWLEKKFLLRADVVVSLTQAAVYVMRGFPYLVNASTHFEVITTCTDLEIFRRANSRPKASTAFTLCYLGSVGTRYMFDEVLECFVALRKIRADARLLIINRAYHEYIQGRLRHFGVSEVNVDLKALDYRHVGDELNAVDAGIFFYKPAFSTLATAPTKLGEFLACGIPCLTNSGVGDCEELLKNNRVGVVMGGYTPEERTDAVRRLIILATDPDIAPRCVNVAREHFSLEAGVQKYEQIYRHLNSARTQR
jgi:glycosyltransferase involved in cell wall biosynthesis